MSEFCKHNTHESQYCGSCHREQIESRDEKIKILREALDNANECIKAGFFIGWRTVEWDKCIAFSEETLRKTGVK